DLETLIDFFMLDLNNASGCKLNAQMVDAAAHRIRGIVKLFQRSVPELISLYREHTSSEDSCRGRTKSLNRSKDCFDRGVELNPFNPAPNNPFPLTPPSREANPFLPAASEPNPFLSSLQPSARDMNPFVPSAREEEETRMCSASNPFDAPLDDVKPTAILGLSDIFGSESESASPFAPRSFAGDAPSSSADAFEPSARTDGLSRDLLSVLLHRAEQEARDFIKQIRHQATTLLLLHATSLSFMRHSSIQPRCLAAAAASAPPPPLPPPPPHLSSIKME
ncbi:MAG: hypothetical protein SGPRY_001507, partial [Prymnesium sp.]